MFVGLAGEVVARALPAVTKTASSDRAKTSPSFLVIEILCCGRQGGETTEVDPSRGFGRTVRPGGKVRDGVPSRRHIPVSSLIGAAGARSRARPDATLLNTAARLR